MLQSVQIFSEIQKIQFFPLNQNIFFDSHLCQQHIDFLYFVSNDIYYDHNGRSALEIYEENSFYNVLNDLNVGFIVGKLWYDSGHEQSILFFLD